MGGAVRNIRPHGGNLKRITINIIIRSTAPTQVDRPLSEGTVGKINTAAWIKIFTYSIVKNKVNMTEYGVREEARCGRPLGGGKNSNVVMTQSRRQQRKDIGKRINTDDWMDKYTFIGNGMKKTEHSAREKGGTYLPHVRDTEVNSEPMDYCLPPKVRSTATINGRAWKTKRNTVNNRHEDRYREGGLRGSHGQAPVRVHRLAPGPSGQGGTRKARTK